jgi:hypothetical protein
MTQGTSAISGSAMVPIGGVVSTQNGNESTFVAGTSSRLNLIPAIAWDYALSSETTFGVEVATYTPLTLGSSSNADFLGVFVNPRFETALDSPGRHLAFTIDLNLGYIHAGNSSTPFFAPNVGLRLYLPTGFGGAIISQQLGTAIVSLALPGSIAYDVPIPLGGARFHFFPEFRWDPTFVFAGIGSSSVYFVLFSAGLSFMLEI